MTDSPDIPDTPKAEQDTDPSFSTKAQRVILAYGEALLPADVGLPIAADEENLIKPAKGFIRGLDSRGFGAAGIFCMYLNIQPMLLFFAPRTFLGLSPERRMEFLEYWESHRFFPIRLAFFPIKALLGLLYTLDPRYDEAVGYSPGSMTKDRKAAEAAGASS